MTVFIDNAEFTQRLQRERDDWVTRYTHRAVEYKKLQDEFKQTVLLVGRIAQRNDSTSIPDILEIVESKLKGQEQRVTT